ncbi:MAG: hypothetical protein V7606_3878 [Burkholderiales bacterium]|jgi:hypothetical protein|nr:hypothetical protein [Burkholderia sp.]
MSPHRIRVTPRLLPFLVRWLLTTLLLALTIAPLSARAAVGIEITQVKLENTDEGYKLAANFAVELNRGLEDAITRGVPLYFTTEVEFTRPRWYWFDERAITATQTIRISYDVLTRQYHASMSGRLHQSFSSLDDALSLLRRPSRWVVAEKGELKPGATYNVAIRMGLDVARLPKPFQINALNNSDWRLSSDWKQFSFRAD